MKLRYASRAYADIAGIYEYISQHNATAATSVVRQIRITSRLLARYPGLGRDTDIPGVRVFPTGRYPYLLYHRVRAGELVILHVRDGRRDSPREREL
jgi:plasmid stabilization system protein ParE